METTTTDHTQAALEAVYRIHDYEEMRKVYNTVKMHLESLKAAHTSQLRTTMRVGDTFRLNGLSPKYVNGYTVEVVGVHVTKASVRLADPFAPARVRDRLRGTFKVPIQCLDAAV